MPLVLRRQLEAVEGKARAHHAGDKRILAGGYRALPDPGGNDQLATGTVLVYAQRHAPGVVLVGLLAVTAQLERYGTGAVPEP